MRLTKEEVSTRIHKIIDDLESRGIEINRNRVATAYEHLYDTPISIRAWITRCPEVESRIQAHRIKSVCWDETIKNPNKWRAYGEKKRKAIEEMIEEERSKFLRWKQAGAVTRFEGMFE